MHRFFDNPTPAERMVHLSGACAFLALSSWSLVTNRPPYTWIFLGLGCAFGAAFFLILSAKWNPNATFRWLMTVSFLFAGVGSLWLAGIEQEFSHAALVLLFTASGLGALGSALVRKPSVRTGEHDD